MGNSIEEKILSLKVEYAEAIDGISKYMGAINAATNKQKELKKQLQENKISQAAYNTEMAASKAVVTECKDVIRVLEKEIQNNIKAEKGQEHSLISLRAQLSNTTKAYDNLSRIEREGAKGQEFKNKINEITRELKGAEEETGRFYRNVGNYQEAITKAAESHMPFIGQVRASIETVSSFKNYLSDLKSELDLIGALYKTNATAASGLSGAQKAAAVSTNLVSTAMKLFKVALVSTGIGAIVVILGSLIAYLTKTQKGTELLSKAMAAIGAVINVIIDRLAKIGGALVKVFSGDFKGAAEDMKQSLSGIGEEIANEAKLAIKLKESLDELEKREIMLSMRRAASRSEMEKLKLIADDTTKSLQERIAAAEKAYKMEEEMAAESIKLGKQQLANMLGQVELSAEVEDMLKKVALGAITADEVISKLGLSESTVEDLKEFSTVFNEVAQKESESYTRNKETQNKINSMRKEAADKAKEAKQKELEAIRQAEDSLLSLVKDGFEKQRKEISLSYSRQIQDLQIKLKEEKNLTKKAREEINATIITLQKKQQQDLNKLSDDEIKDLIGKEQKRIELTLESVKKGSDEEYSLRRDLLESKKEQELENTELTEQERLLIIAKYQKQEQDLVNEHNAELRKKQMDAVKVEFEEKLMAVRGKEVEALQIKLEQKQREISTLQQLEGESNESFRLRQLEADNEYLDAKQELAEKELDIEIRKAEAISMLMDGIMNLTDAMGEKSKAAATLSKVIAIAQVAISQGVAIAKAVETATRSSVTWVDMLVAVATVVAGVTAVMGTAMKSIKQAKFAQGGVFDGNGYVSGEGTGTSDSINARLSNGESVLTAQATQMFAPMLSAFNTMGGGVPINVSVSSSQAIGEDMLARAVAKGYMLAPAPIISVEEFTSVANRVKNFESISTV